MTPAAPKRLSRRRDRVSDDRVDNAAECDGAIERHGFDAAAEPVGGRRDAFFPHR
jgi:hypothetical protein